MTPEQFAERMAVCMQTSDIETRHYEADQLLCTMLVELGYGEGVRTYQTADKWFA